MFTSQSVAGMKGEGVSTKGCNLRISHDISAAFSESDGSAAGYDLEFARSGPSDFLTSVSGQPHGSQSKFSILPLSPP